MTPFTKGLHDFGNGCYAYLQPDGSWGWSNAGLIVDGDQSLLVDTLFDLKLTAEMLAEIRRSALPSGRGRGPGQYAFERGPHLWQSARRQRAQGSPLAPGSIRRDWAKMGLAGAFFEEVMGRVFSAEGVVLTLPSQTFSGGLELAVGSKAVRLIEVGPAHTRGDVIAYVPADRTVFTGDILFVDGHPLVWEGPVSNWIRALNFIIDLDVETVVPGHGPVTGKDGVRRLRDYFSYVLTESQKRYTAGMDYEAAANVIRIDAFKDWLDPERLVVNVFACYRDIDPSIPPASMMALREQMARRYFATHPPQPEKIA